MKKTIGGDRLGSGAKMQVDLHGYERSTHDLGYVWRSTMSAGTLVPFIKELALPGDTFDIDLNVDVKTHPTVGPLFGSYKVQLDVFQCPIRLYQGLLHNNKLGIGLNMSAVKLPLVNILAPNMKESVITLEDFKNIDLDNSQINPSCIFSYLGIRGGGFNSNSGAGPSGTYRTFNAVPWLGYWDIYKNYYANKQEEIGAVIHTGTDAVDENVGTVVHDGNGIPQNTPGTGEPIYTNDIISILNSGTFQDTSMVIVLIQTPTVPEWVPWDSLFDFVQYNNPTQDYSYNGSQGGTYLTVYAWAYSNTQSVAQLNITTFPLSNLDDIREQILAATTTPVAFELNTSSVEPFNLALKEDPNENWYLNSKYQTQEGLGLKTYQSDLFNNWLSTDWIDGANGISELTAVDTSGGSFTMDTLALSKKVYDMLNRIAISGGSYEDWIDAVYSHDRYTRAESPIYHGGLIKELIFQEVVSNAASTAENQPLGTLAGKGILAQKHKGGQVTIKVDEPSYIIGIVSLTPRIDYSQGNDWDTHLLTLDDLHKPALDEIGFQELITEQMAWWDTKNDYAGAGWTTKSAGKQPAWINYMTNFNRVRGNFAIKDNEMFMTLNRRYEPEIQVNNGEFDVAIKDLTTYVDPRKFNHLFAETALDAQNFWTQIAVDMNVRRKISAKIMPNL